jgi:sulfite reductase (ferredoxin)
VVDAITSRFVAERSAGESFQDYIARLGKKELGAMIAGLKAVPSRDADPSPYTDWGDARAFTMGDLGVGECAGEVISRIDLELSAAESVAFEAQVALEEGDLARADDRAYAAMLAGALALVRTEWPDVPADPDSVVSEFKARFYDTERFFDRFAKGRFARPLFDRHAAPPPVHEPEATRVLVEEAQLFIDAVHAFEIREAGAQSALV